MDDTREENTEWVRVWIVNDNAYYDMARVQAAAGAKHLRAFLTAVLTTAAPDSVAGIQAREMSEADYDRVDWEEIAECLRDDEA